MFEGIIDSIATSIIGTAIKYVWNYDKILKIIFFIMNPPIFLRYRFLKRYPSFEYDFIEIKKLLFNNKNIENNSLLKKIDYKTHGKNYLDFRIIDSNALFHMEITNYINSFDENSNETQNLILKIQSNSATTVEYRKCENVIDLKIITHIYNTIEKHYNLIENFSSFELISSNNKKIEYPKNAFKKTNGINEIIYDKNSLSIKSSMQYDLINCLNRYKFKLFKK